MNACKIKLYAASCLKNHRSLLLIVLSGFWEDLQLLKITEPILGTYEHKAILAAM